MNHNGPAGMSTLLFSRQNKREQQLRFFFCFCQLQTAHALMLFTRYGLIIEDHVENIVGIVFIQTTRRLWLWKSTLTFKMLSNFPSFYLPSIQNNLWFFKPFLSSSILAAWPAHRNLLELITLTILGEQCKLRICWFVAWLVVGLFVGWLIS